MKGQGASGGKIGGFDAEKNMEKHKEWIINILLRLVCLLSLDRFGDYVSDQVYFSLHILNSPFAINLMLKLIFNN